VWSAAGQLRHCTLLQLFVAPWASVLPSFSALSRTFLVYTAPESAVSNGKHRGKALSNCRPRRDL